MGGSTTLAITTTSLGGANAGEANSSQTLTGTGGSTPRNWTILSGTLPKGLNLNASSALISGNVGVSTDAQTFTIQRSDKSGLSTTRQFTIQVDSSPIFICGDSTHRFEGHYFDFHFVALGSRSDVLALGTPAQRRRL